MNRILATILDVANVFTAAGIILVSAFAGAKLYAGQGEMALIGYVVGSVIGCFFAALICGVISMLSLIEKHLRFIASSVEYQNVITKMQIDGRIDPRM